MKESNMFKNIPSALSGRHPLAAFKKRKRVSSRSIQFLENTEEKIMKKSAIITLALSASLLSACSNTSASSSEAKQVLNWFSAGEISTMDPALNNDVYGGEQLDATMEGLVRLGNNSKVLPGIAKSWKKSKDGMTWTFKLRKNAKWSNGEALTAKDFVYAWRRQVNPKTASTQSNKYSGIKNADAIVASKKPVSSLGIKAVGKYKLVVTLERKIPYFQLLLAGSAFAPQKQKFIEKAGKKYGTAAKYTLSDGPFVMKGWTGSNLTWKLVKNKYYWDKKNVKLTKINFSVQKSQSTSYNLYQAKKLDATSLDSSQIKQLKSDKAFTLLPQGGTYYMEFGQGKSGNEYVKNANIRKALSLAIDRGGLVSTIDGGASQPANTLTSKELTKVNGKDYTSLISSSAKSLYPKDGNKKLAKQYLAKGLEFDAVIVWDANATKYAGDDERQLLYTICSRAMHTLTLVAVGQPTALLDRVAPELYEIHPVD